MQAWKWRIYDWQRERFVKLGNNKAAAADTWSVLTFAAKAKKKGGLARFVDSETGAVRLELRSGNDRADAFLDQEVLVLSVRELPSLGACTLFPADHYWNTPIDHLPVDERSDDYVTALGASDTVHPDFGAGLWQGAPIGIPSDERRRRRSRSSTVSFYYDDEATPGPTRSRPMRRSKAARSRDGDRHVLVVDNDACLLYELFDAHPNKDGSWDAEARARSSISRRTRSGPTAGPPPTPPASPSCPDSCATTRSPRARSLTRSASPPQTRNAYVWPARTAPPAAGTVRATCTFPRWASASASVPSSTSRVTRPTDR